MGTFYYPLNCDSATYSLLHIYPDDLILALFVILMLVLLSSSLLDLTNCLGFKQIICEPNHFSHISSPSLIHYVFVLSDISCPSYVLPPISSSDHLAILFSVPLAQGVKHSLKGSIDFVKYGSTIRPTLILPTFYIPLFPEIVFALQRCQLGLSLKKTFLKSLFHLNLYFQIPPILGVSIIFLPV